MKINMTKTLSQHVFKREAIAVTDEEAREIEVTFAKGDLRLEKACSYTVQAANTTMIRLMKCMSWKT